MTGPLRRAAGQGVPVVGPALALLEVRSIARGVLVADAVVKRATVRLCLSRPVSTGKHLTLLCGGEAEVEESFGAGLQVAGDWLLDKLLLPQAHDELLLALQVGSAMAAEPRPAGEELSLGVLETGSAASAILAADAACKAAAVRLYALRLCDGIGGKGYFLLLGEHGDVEAGLLAAEQILGEGAVLGRELIPRPYDELLATLAAEGLG